MEFRFICCKINSNIYEHKFVFMYYSASKMSGKLCGIICWWIGKRNHTKAHRLLNNTMCIEHIEYIEHVVKRTRFQWVKSKLYFLIASKPKYLFRWPARLWYVMCSLLEINKNKCIRLVYVLSARTNWVCVRDWANGYRIAATMTHDAMISRKVCRKRDAKQMKKRRKIAKGPWFFLLSARLVFHIFFASFPPSSSSISFVFVVGFEIAKLR